MRIIAGQYRGKKLFTPSSDSVRPTSDRARESVFNIIRAHLNEEVKLLDVFAGTGAFGLEALSRGVKKVVLVDLDVTLAKKNAALFSKEAGKVDVIKADATKLPSAREKFDIVFMDAPYKKGLSEKAIESLIQNGWLKENALLIVEMEKKENIETTLEVIDERIYGVAKFLFLRFK